MSDLAGLCRMSDLIAYIVLYRDLSGYVRYDMKCRICPIYRIYTFSDYTTLNLAVSRENGLCDRFHKRLI